MICSHPRVTLIVDTFHARYGWCRAHDGPVIRRHGVWRRVTRSEVPRAVRSVQEHHTNHHKEETMEPLRPTLVKVGLVVLAYWALVAYVVYVNF